MNSVLQRHISTMPPTLSTIVGHAVSQPAEASPAATNTDPQPSERLISMTPGSDFIIRLHVEDKQEVKGTIWQDSETIKISPTDSKIGASTAKNNPTTWLRVPTRVSSRQTQTLVVPALTQSSAFRTMVASASSRVTENPRASISYPRTMSTQISSASVEGWTSRAPIQQATPIPAAIVSNGRVSEGPISNITLSVLITVIGLAVWFSYHVIIINCWGGRSFGYLFRLWKKKLVDEGVSGCNSKDTKFGDTKLRPGNSSSSSLQFRESSRINMRKANVVRSSSHTASSPSITSSLSPPQTPRASSYSEFAPQAVTSSSAYNTPSATPIQSSFPNTNFPPTSSLRHRANVPPSLLIEPPSPTTRNTATGVDLEDQTPMQTPRFAALHPGLSRHSSGESLGMKEDGDRKLPRIGSSRWVAGVVDKVTDGVVRWTRDADYEKPCLPTSEW